MRLKIDPTTLFHIFLTTFNKIIRIFHAFILLIISYLIFYCRVKILFRMVLRTYKKENNEKKLGILDCIPGNAPLHAGSCVIKKNANRSKKTE